MLIGCLINNLLSACLALRGGQGERAALCPSATLRCQGDRQGTVLGGGTGWERRGRNHPELPRPGISSSVARLHEVPSLKQTNCPFLCKFAGALLF